MTHPGALLPHIDLVSLDGRPTALQEHLGHRPTLVLAMRYYGCLPCQHYLLALHHRRQEFEDRGIDVVVVGVAADFQAQHLAVEYGIAFPMLLDPEQHLYRALSIPRLRPLDFLRPATWRIYLPLFWHRYVTRRVDGPRQGRIVGDPAQLPGMAIVDEDRRLQWVHRGASLGDYPPVSDVLARVDELGLSRTV